MPDTNLGYNTMATKIARAIEINNEVVNNVFLDPDLKESLINEFRELEAYVTKYGTNEEICKFYGV